MDEASHPTASESIRSSPACSASSAARRQARSASPDWHLIHQSRARTCQSCARPAWSSAASSACSRAISLPAHQPGHCIRIDLKARRQPGNLRSGLQRPVACVDGQRTRLAKRGLRLAEPALLAVDAAEIDEERRSIRICPGEKRDRTLQEVRGAAAVTG